ncbi:uncharacterized protein VTP21DRAFT_6131 [Calcarisporiella thermophila]|uniref:uncharacterized protein n=1 Tax=Calcarisporiella thermophila TaxID=911321 RepID=UPI003743E26B
MNIEQNQNRTSESTHNYSYTVQSQYSWLHIISIICALIMMAITIYLRCKRPTISNTISLKLSLWIGLVDVLSRANFLIRVNPSLMNITVSTIPWFPRLLVYTSFFFLMWFAFLSAAIALDLHLSFLCRRVNIKIIQRFYSPLAALVSSIIPLPFLFVGNIYWNPEFQIVYISLERTQAIILETFCYDLWMASAILYSFAVILAVVFRVFKSLHIIRENFESTSVDMQARERQFTYSVLRILLYPMVLLICCPAGIILDWIYYMNPEISPSVMAAMRADAITSGLQGILNLLVFLLNPAVVRALSHYKIFSNSLFSADEHEGNQNIMNTEQW